MNILIAINEKYLEPVKTMLFSLACQHKNELVVYMLYRTIDRQKINDLRIFIEGKWGGELHAIYVDELLFRNVPIVKWWTEEIYYRLIAFDLLPPDVSRVLWLDADIIVNGDLEGFYSQDVGDAFAVACPGSNQTLKKGLNLPEEHVYFNSGVILFNLQKIRTCFSTDQVLRCVNDYKECLRAPDQDVLNILFASNVKYADERIYNHETFGYCVIGKKEMAVLKKEAKIIHFTGPMKPWNPKGANWADSFWWKYDRRRGRIKEWMIYRLLNFPIKLYYNLRELYYFMIAQFRKIKKREDVER